MASIDKQIMINAPPDKIYDFVIKPSNLTKFWPSLVESKKRKYYPMADIALSGNTECQAYIYQAQPNVLMFTQ